MIPLPDIQSRFERLVTPLPDMQVGRPFSRATHSRPGSRSSSSSCSWALSSDDGSSLSRVSTASTLPSVSDLQCEIESHVAPKRDSKLKKHSSLPKIAGPSKASRSSSQPRQAKPLEESTKPQRAIRKDSLEVTDPQQCLLDAAFNNDVGAVKLLALEDLEGLRKHVDYVLLYAIMEGSYDVVKLLFWYGASLDAKNAPNHLTIWDCAARSPEPEIMKEFLGTMKTGHVASESIRRMFA